MREKDIEQYLVRRIRESGGKAYKFVSPGNAGVPDRIAIFPGGVVKFIELKAPGAKVRPLQVAQIAKMREFGLRVYVIDSKEGVDGFLKEVRKS